MLKVNVIIPVYNEQDTIIEVLEAVNRQRIEGVEFEVIVIDDGSTDATLERLNGRPDLAAQVVALPRNRGKGGAVKEGLARASGDFILFQDADLEYDPHDYAALLFPILQFDADVVIGSRLSAPRYTRVHYYWHHVGNRLITFCFNLFNNTTFTDIYTCYLVYRRSLVDASRLRSEGWDQHAEILSRAVHAGTAYYEVPISYRGRSYSEGKKIRWYHTLQILLRIARERVVPGR